ncbi:hypothetical protein [Streptomyces flaveolus]|uniref:hypothetical protein n=1 Tax=Streptomyces flaveolus TaxID=67297 RepID=UPI0036FAED60
MTVPQCVNSPGEELAHGVRQGRVSIVVVLIVVIVAGCAGVTPEWIAAAAALITATAAGR